MTSAPQPAPAPRPWAMILVHPGSMLAHGGGAALEQAVHALAQHPGPRIVIDGFLSDLTAPFDARIASALRTARAEGHVAARLWGCDAGEDPFPGWPGQDLPTPAGLAPVFDSQQTAAAALLPFLRDHDILLSGAWATRDDRSGCVNSVGEALEAAGHPGSRVICDS